MNKLHLYCVRFTMLNGNDIYLELNLHHHTSDGAVDLARYIIAETMGIHEDRLCLESVTLEN